MTVRALAIALLVAVATPPVRAQSTSARVTGEVFDQLAGRGLVGARVWVTSLADSTTIVVATTDASGAYALDVAPGTYVLRFAHPALADVGIGDRPTPLDPADTTALRLAGARVVRVAAGEGRTIDLETPSLARLRSLCAAPVPDGGVLFGVVRESQTGARLANAGVVVAWTSITRTDRAGVSVVPHEARLTTDSAGRYAACGIPLDTQIGIRAVADTVAGAPVERFVHTAPGVARQDIAIDLVALAASAVVIGDVRDAEGRPVVGATITLDVDTTPLARSRANGRFMLTSALGGSHMLEARALGARAARVPIELRRGDTTRVTLRLEKVQLLAEQTVEARSGELLRVPTATLAEVAARQRMGLGYIMLREQIVKRPSVRALFSEFPGLRWIEIRAGMGRPAITNLCSPDGPCPPGAPLPPAVLVVDGGVQSLRGRGLCAATVFLDGTRVPQEVLQDTWPVDLVAVEVYTRRTDAPQQYNRLDVPCGIVLLWTQSAP